MLGMEGVVEEEAAAAAAAAAAVAAGLIDVEALHRVG
jgi:hypothetical protein